MQTTSIFYEFYIIYEIIKKNILFLNEINLKFISMILAEQNFIQKYFFF